VEHSLPDTGQALYSFFIAAAIGLIVLVVALGAALVISQHRVLGLHRDYGRRLLATQDEERAWVAREVHDDVVQRIAVLRHEVEAYKAMAGGVSAEQRRRLQGLEGEIEDLGVALRQLAHRLHPSTLDHGDLHVALAQLAEETERLHGLYVQVDADVPPDFRAPELTLATYRIGQEALRNVARHAGVTGARVAVVARGDRLVLTIRDDGRGFDPGAAAGKLRRAGLGLLTMRERAIQAGGTTEILSAPGEGTTIRVTLPIGRRA
jgi:signal transduction histidine kinase